MAKRKNSVIRRVLLLAVCVYLLYSLGDLQHQLIKQRKELYEKIEERNTLKYEVEEYLNLLENGDDAELIEKRQESVWDILFRMNKFLKKPVNRVYI